MYDIQTIYDACLCLQNNPNWVYNCQKEVLRCRQVSISAIVSNAFQCWFDILSQTYSSNFSLFLENLCLLSPRVNFLQHDKQEVFYELRPKRINCPQNVIITYLCMNSFHYKFMELCDLLNFSGECFFAKTKLDDSFNQTEFNVPGYRSFRNEMNGNGGGHLVSYSSSLPARRRTDLKSELPIESTVLDITINHRKC